MLVAGWEMVALKCAARWFGLMLPLRALCTRNVVVRTRALTALVPKALALMVQDLVALTPALVALALDRVLTLALVVQARVRVLTLALVAQVPARARALVAPVLPQDRALLVPLARALAPRVHQAHLRHRRPRAVRSPRVSSGPAFRRLPQRLTQVQARILTLARALDLDLDLAQARILTLARVRVPAQALIPAVVALVQAPIRVQARAQSQVKALPMAEVALDALKQVREEATVALVVRRMMAVLVARLTMAAWVALVKAKAWATPMMVMAVASSTIFAIGCKARVAAKETTCLCSCPRRLPRPLLVVCTAQRSRSTPSLSARMVRMLVLTLVLAVVLARVLMRAVAVVLARALMMAVAAVLVRALMVALALVPILTAAVTRVPARARTLSAAVAREQTLRWVAKTRLPRCVVNL